MKRRSTHPLAALAAGVVSLMLIMSVVSPAEAARGGKRGKPTPPPPPAPALSCGAAVPKTATTAWECTFADEFSGTSLNTDNWFVQTTDGSGFQGGGDCFVNTADNVSVASGVLSLTTRREAAPFTCKSPYGDYTSQHTSGMVSTYTKFAQAYGRFEIRAKFPASTVQGLHSALWLWPEDASKYGSWPASGEIDIAERYSAYPDRAIPYIHYNTSLLDPSVTNNYCLINDISSFHTYLAEWTANAITISYDGQVCVTHAISPLAPLTGSAPFDQPFIVALTQALGVAGNDLVDSTPLPATTQIDYVHVWK
ncbi:hypothetical protein C6I20_14715 [Aeromicrobium sp. A1-2]|uniref:glycoside hydrolase family 16 protein n=1 Tax=Aeromicrobium sp. A1-2 TaxID=2107713 RepID=UPI000E4D7DB8|nr:glycoside hydrolase family 16 protein [Aeromicrobium sp. A1-2]AXT86307.1 hypothetical protein C6I20_14715 [Aeromicrobium sp. A1-2]